MLADTRDFVLPKVTEVLFTVLRDKFLQLFELRLLIGLHLLPKRDCIGVPFGVLDVITLDTPEAFVLLNELLHQIVSMIALHDVSVMANA